MEPIQISKPWYKGPKIIFLLLGVVVLIELIWGMSKILAPIPKAPSPARVIPKVSDAQISLLSDKKVYKAGERVIVNIKLFTSGHSVSGTDLSLTYDPKILQASASAFLRGRIFADYPQINIDNINGLISISGVAGLNKKYFNGSGNFGTINFVARTPGQISLNIQFTKGSTTDTNVFDASSNQDVLGQVSNLQIVIQ